MYLLLACGDGDLLDDFVHEVRHNDRIVATQVDARLLLSDRNASLTLTRIVRVDDRADAVLEAVGSLARTIVSARIGRE